MEKDELFQEPYIDESVYRYKRKKKVGRIIKLSILGVFAAAYFTGVAYFYTHFTNNTVLNGYDISYKSVEEVDRLIGSELGAYSLDVLFTNGTATIKNGDGSLTYKLDISVKNIKKRQNPFLWFMYMFSDNEMSVKYIASYDEKDMRTYISNMEYMKPYNMEPSIDARVRMQDGEAYVVDDITGTVVDAEEVYKAVFEALDGYEASVDIYSKQCYIPAQITSDSAVIEKGLENATEYLDIKAEYDFAGYIINIPREELSTLAYIDDRGELVISKTNVENYAREFSEKYSTSYTERSFKTHDRKNITVYGGYYGWQLDPEKEAEELYELLCDGGNFTKEPACEHRGYAYGKDNDIGDTYVEIDLSDQRVYAFVDGELKVETSCVSGNTSAGRNTPGGLYGLTYKAMNVTLKGEDYETPVTYWMPFNGGIGMHDATWRGRFGGSIYYYSGSHGCVNLPYSAAAEIYSVVEAGMPIVCYWD